MNELLISFPLHPTLEFAAGELAAYLARMGNPARLASAGEEGDIRLAVAPEPGRDPRDDGFAIHMQSAQGEITGPTPRSVLLGVYRYLALCGCAFLYPGPRGEVIPTAPPADCQCREDASFRYRCVSIEGANARENVLDMIDWLPKAGLNSYHVQLLDGYTFYERWYSHARNPYKEAQPVTAEETAGYIREVVAEAKKRDLLVQYMGHGWTGEPFGIRAKGWDREELDLPAETLELLAMVNGKRQVWKNIPVDTNACYSNPQVRHRMAAYIADFAAAHPETDLLHVWLGDDWNNYCECETCRQKRPSDWYVALLNEVDAELARRGLPVRIVFLVYSDLLWPPLAECFHNPDRFVLLFAPVSLDYTKPFDLPETPPAPAPFRLNHITLPATAAENVGYLNAWREGFKGDSFVYIYHLLSTGWEKDLGGLFLAEMVHEDIRRFGKLGMNGASACQAQRVAFPTGFAQYVMARTLWQQDLTMKALQREYFSAAFGPRWREALAFLRKVEEFFPPAYLQGNQPRQSGEAAGRFALVRPWAQSVRATLQDAREHLPEAQGYNWRLLIIFAALLEALGPLFQAIAQGEKGAVLRPQWEGFQRLLFSYEDELQTVYDMEWGTRNFELFEVRGLKHFVNDAPEWED